MSKSGGRRRSQPQLEFHGCIFPLDSDKFAKPAKLTREQNRQLAEIIYLCFKQWYAQ